MWTVSGGWAAVLTAALVVGYYGAVVRLVGEPLARRVLTGLLDGSRLARVWSFADLDGVVRLLLAGAMQLGFLLGLIALFRLAPHDLGLGSVNPVLILLGVPLGVAEAALATYVGFVGCRVAERLRGADTPQTLQGWLTVARGGWIRYYLRTASVAPTWLLVGATALYVAGEELVFRGVVLHAAHGWGAPAALLLSVALFTAAQVFYTPNWRTAMFPVLGAVVLGIVHGCLFLTVPDVTPLIVAHAVMFLITVL